MSNSSPPRVVIERKDGIATVALNRPAKKNGLDMKMFEAIIAAGEELSVDDTIRAVVLHGNGGCFSAGLDFQSVMADADGNVGRLLNERVGPANMAQRVGWVWREVPVPVIAAVDGVAFGGGLQIAAGADIRLATADAKFSLMESKYGLIPDMGITKTLGPIVRPDILKELVWTGRVFDATEAAAIGVVTRIVDDALAAATELATTIASKNPHATRASKRMLEEAQLLPPHQAFALESDLQRPILGSANQMEAVMATFEGRQPSFVDVNEQ